MIDHLELANLPPQIVRQRGKLPGGIGYLSDHYVQLLLGLKLHHPKPRAYIYITKLSIVSNYY